MHLIDRVRGMLIRPAAEWAAIEHESGTPSFLFRNYVAKLAAIPAIAEFVGGSLIGGLGIGAARTPLMPGLIMAAISYLLSFALVYALAVAIDTLAERFGGKRDFQNALKLAAYSFTPAWLAGVCWLLPGLHWLAVLGLYGVYLLWLGLQQLLKMARLPAGYVAVAAALAALLVNAVLGLMLPGYAMMPL